MFEDLSGKSSSPQVFSLEVLTNDKGSLQQKSGWNLAQSHAESSLFPTERLCSLDVTDCDGSHVSQRLSAARCRTHLSLTSSSVCASSPFSSCTAVGVGVVLGSGPAAGSPTHVGTCRTASRQDWLLRRVLTAASVRDPTL